MENDEQHQRKTMKKQERTRKTLKERQRKTISVHPKKYTLDPKAPRVQTPDLEFPIGSREIFYFYMLRLKAVLLILTYKDKKKESREN